MNDLAPSILDTAQRLEEANLYYNLSTLLGRDIAGLVDKLPAISPEVESLQKNGPLSASSARSGPHDPTTASIRETFIESIRPEPEPKHFNTDIETLLHALSEWTGVDLEVAEKASFPPQKVLTTQIYSRKSLEHDLGHLSPKSQL